MEHYKNLDLSDIVYFCEFDLVWKTEQWKDIVGHEGNYKVSDLGRVNSLSRLMFNGHAYFKSKEKILKPYLNSHGYLQIAPSKNGIEKPIVIHQLVSIAFLNHTPCGFKLVINHKNFIKTDNRVKNLEIVTNRENSNQKHIKSSSKYTGVVWNKALKKWRANIHINSKLINLGSFETEEEASFFYEQSLIAYNNDKEIIVKKPILTSKHKGVTWNKRLKKWVSQKTINNKNKHLGCFLTEEEARLKYINS